MTVVPPVAVPLNISMPPLPLIVRPSPAKVSDVVDAFGVRSR